jgi:hypothetical protein
MLQSHLGTFAGTRRGDAIDPNRFELQTLSSAPQAKIRMHKEFL